MDNVEKWDLMSRFVYSSNKRVESTTKFGNPRTSTRQVPYKCRFWGKSLPISAKSAIFAVIF